MAVLRSADRAGPTLAALAAAGIEAVGVPLFRLEPIDWWLPPGSFDALVLTSANAARFAGWLPVLPTWTVGPATAAAARAAGLQVVHVGDAGADALFAALDAAGVTRSLWLAGEDRRVVRTRHDVQAVSVYRARPIAADPASMSGTVALVHSPRAGERLAALVPAGTRRDISVVAISAAAAAACGNGWRDLEIAPRPDDAAMISTAIDRARGDADKRRR